jgi:NADH-quinone oxidoreductase subunit F
MFEPVLTRNINRPGSEKIRTYLEYGGYEAVRIALSKSPSELIDIVKRSGLRGRGGAGLSGGLCRRLPITQDWIKLSL